MRIESANIALEESNNNWNDKDGLSGVRRGCILVSASRHELQKLISGNARKPPEGQASLPQPKTEAALTVVAQAKRVIHIFDTNVERGDVVSFAFSEGLTANEEDAFLDYVLKFQGQNARLPSATEAESFYASAILAARAPLADDPELARLFAENPMPVRGNFDWQRFEDALENHKMGAVASSASD